MQTCTSDRGGKSIGPTAAAAAPGVVLTLEKHISNFSLSRCKLFQALVLTFSLFFKGAHGGGNEADFEMSQNGEACASAQTF